MNYSRIISAALGGALLGWVVRAYVDRPKPVDIWFEREVWPPIPRNYSR